MSGQQASVVNGSAAASAADVELTRVLEAYLGDLEAGRLVDPARLLTEHPTIADRLRACLASLHLVQQGGSVFGTGLEASTEQGPALGQLGDFHILREVGRGGMGVVYEAVQISLGRQVALKVLPFAAALDAKQLQRFKNEAQAAAHLHHTNIVPVFAVGCERGVHYYAMQYIEGQTLADLIGELRRHREQATNGPSQAPPKLSAVADELLSGRLAPARRPAGDGHPSGRHLPATAAGPLTSAETAPQAADSSTEHSLKDPAYFRSVANLGVQAALALEHAHQLGVVHRDIKPANLLVDRRGNLWITDFGLAHCQHQAGLTMSGDLVGTLRYMSPEQALAKRVPVDHRTDVYSLGTTLYELLTLEHAFDGRDRQELLRQIAFEEPRPPRRRNKSIAVELETIILKAMAKNPGERYATAQELADDLRRFLEDKPIKAKRSTMVLKIKKWARRKPALAGLVVLSAVAALLLAVVVGGFMLLRETEKQRQKAVQAGEEEGRQRKIAEDAQAQEGRHRKIAEDARAEAEKLKYFRNIALAGVEWRGSNIGRMEKLLDDCPPDYQGNWEWQYLKRQCHPELLALESPQGGVYKVAFSPDGKRLAAAILDGTLKVWDVATGREEFTLPAQHIQTMALAFTPDGERVASSGWDGTIRFWDAATGREVQPKIQASKTLVHGLAFSPDCKWLASASFDGTVKIWDVMTWKERRFPAENERAYLVDFSPDGKWLAATRSDQTGTLHTVTVWDVASGHEIVNLKGHDVLLSGLAFSPDGTRLASAGYDRKVKIWDTAPWRTGRVNGKSGPVHTLGHTSRGIGIAFSPDGKRVASGYDDRTVKIWDVDSGKETLSLSGHSNTVFAVAFSPDGTRLASASHDGTVKFWDTTTGPEERTLRGHTGAVEGVAFSPDGERLASAGKDKTVRLWHIATGQEERKRRLEGHHGSVAAVAFNSDGNRLASASADKTVKVWDVKNARLIHELAGDAELLSVAFSPDDKWIASGDAKGTVKVWEAATGRVYDDIKAHDRGVLSVAFSPDGKWLATAAQDRAVKIWNAATGKPVHRLEKHVCWVHNLAFSPDLTRVAAQELPNEDGGPRPPFQLASISGEGSVKFWDANTGDLVGSIENLGGHADSVAFSRDGRRLATAAGVVRFWDVLTGNEVLSLKGRADYVLSVAFSRDGTRLAAASQDATVKIWDSRPLTPQIKLEREALALLDFLFARPLRTADVIDFLHESQTIRPEVRQQALAWVARYHEEQDPKRYHEAGWDIARRPYLNAFQYRQALRQAETACRLDREEDRYRSTLGVAQYRARLFKEALATLTGAEQRKQDNAAGLAFLAMTQYRLDQMEQAQATLNRLRKVAQEPRWTQDAAVHGFLREAETLIASR